MVIYILSRLVKGAAAILPGRRRDLLFAWRRRSTQPINNLENKFRYIFIVVRDLP